MRPRIVIVCGLLALCGLPGLASAEQEALPPPNPATVTVGSQTFTLWPFTSDDFSTAKDPINLIFPNTDPRQVRQALMALDGNRPFPYSIFNCTWSDAEGYDHVAWEETQGWTGSDVQLACGTYAFRVHLRLFRQGSLTMGGAHVDLLISGTAEHETIAWEFPQQFVTQDLIRSQKLAASPSSVLIADTGGYFRAINPLVYSGLPAWLKAIMGLTDNRIPNDGMATVLPLDVLFEPVQDQRREEWTIVYNQFVPKPFCPAGAWDWLLVQGPLQFVLDVHTNPSGYYSRSSTVAGVLNVTPFDMRTGTLGSTVQAVISFSRRSILTDQYSETSETVLQNLLAQPMQSKAWILNAGHSDRYTLTVDCGSANP